ncbi:MAG: hypothetical protein JWM33_1396 [Caulobacteraceae bacterium]|nr:hypothetical protein [Caulobacteraceae bacterium]
MPTAPISSAVRQVRHTAPVKLNGRGTQALGSRSVGMTTLSRPLPQYRPRAKTPEWLVLFYGFLVMLVASAVYSFISRRTYALARKAARMSGKMLDAAMEPLQEPTPARMNSRA